MILAIDVGNTNVTVGVFRGEDLAASWRLSSDRHRTSDEYRAALGSLMLGQGWRLDDCSTAVMSSVVPPIAAEVSNALRAEGLDVQVLGPTDFGFEIRYNPPSSVGADRVANAVAAEKKYGLPAIIVDLGTATTIDAVSADRVYLGGAIAPGIETSLRGLVSQAFQLPMLDLIAPDHVIGTTTLESIRSGTVLGYAALVDGLIDRFLREMQVAAQIIGTGGLSYLIAGVSKHVQTLDPDLTLNGLRLAYEALRS
jgi:type III pantothenate kinase